MELEINKTSKKSILQANFRRFKISGLKISTVFLLTLVIIVGCGKGSSTSAIASITVAPDSLTITVGESQTFQATALDDNGNQVPFTPSWNVIGNIGTITSGGVFTASLQGTGKVRASSGTVYGEANVTVNPADANSFRFVIFGDSRGNSSENPINSSILSSLVNRIVALNPQPVLVLFLGDLVYAGGTDQLNQWKQIMAPITSAGISIYPTIGNHELAVGSATGQQAYQDAFELPTNGPAGYDELAYSVEYKNSLFVCLDSYYFDGTNTNSNLITDVQLSWLSNLLNSSTKTFKFVFTHSPAYPVDGHIGSSLDAYPEKRDAFWSILDNKQVTIFFCGHEHLYSRWRITSAVNSSWQNNVLEIISGGAGAPVYSVSYNRYADALRLNYHFVVADVTSQSVSLNVYDENGNNIDSYSIQK
jgi:hypothetical protein